MNINIKNNKRISFYVMVIAVLMIIIGSIVIIRSIMSYEIDLEAEQDKDLNTLALSSDRNITNMFETINLELKAVAGSRVFENALTNLGEDNESNRNGMTVGIQRELKNFINTHTISQNPLIETILVVKNESVVFSSEGTTGYKLEGNNKWKNAGVIEKCTRADGEPFLAFVYNISKSTKYVALLNLETFYQKVAGSDFSTGDRIMLFSNGNNLFMNQSVNRSGVNIKDSKDVYEFKEDEMFLINSEKRGISGAKTFKENSEIEKNESEKNESKKNDESEIDDSQKRMVSVISRETDNGVFAIGVEADYDKMIKPVKMAIRNMLIFGFMAFVGIALLVITALLSRRREEKILAEAEALRKKNAEIENMAHHQRLEMIGTMTSAVAHEFNNLMTPIMGYSMLSLEQLEKYCDKGDNNLDDIYDNILEVYNTSNKTKKLVKRFSELSRKSNESEFTEVNLHEQVESIKTLSKPAKPDNVELELNICDDECIVEGDGIQISQMILNMVLNAFHALEKDGGSVIVSLENNLKEAVVTVQDNGPGIEEKNLDKIFDPFFTTKGAGVGTGLGLAIVENIVKSHKGEIAVKSEVGKGTCFTVKLPLNS